MKEKNNVLFVLGRYPNPRQNKRIRNAKKNSDVVVISWNKGSLTNLEFMFDDVKFYPIDLKANGTNSLKRIVPTFLFSFKAYKIIKQYKPDILHVENIDMLFTIYMYLLTTKKKPRVIYEIADLNAIIINPQKSMLRKIIQKVVIGIEKICIRRVDLLIVTSEKFYEKYYVNMLSKDKVLMIPNVPDINYFKDYKKKEDGDFTVGFIGGIRYKKQMELLIRAADKSKVKVFFAGFSFDEDIKKLCDKYENIEYYGRYNFEKEISYLYGQVDCVYSVYDIRAQNVKLALPNKLYEAIICELPIIVASGTYLAEQVNKLGVGIEVSAEKEEELALALDTLKNNKNMYENMVRKCVEHKNEMNIEFYNTQLNKIIEKWF